MQGAEVLLLDPAGAAFVATAGELRALAEGYVPVPGQRRPAGPPRRRRAWPSRRGRCPTRWSTRWPRRCATSPSRSARLLQGPDGLVLGVSGPALEPAGLAALAGRVLERAREALPAEGLDLAQVPPDGPGQPVPVARRRGLLRRRS